MQGGKVSVLLLLKKSSSLAETFHEMTVRTESSKADAFYRANGFELDDSASETTHMISL